MVFCDVENLKKSQSIYRVSTHSQQFYTLEQRRKIEGYKAMERAPQGEIRTPNAGWSGLGLSKTSPFLLGATGRADDDDVSAAAAADEKSGGAESAAGAEAASANNAASTTTPTGPQSYNKHPNSGSGGSGAANGSQSSTSNWLRHKTSSSASSASGDAPAASPYVNMNATTGLMDIVPSSQRSLLSHHKDIHSLLTHLGLEHYISELDISNNKFSGKKTVFGFELSGVCVCV